jgi:hypothetical protein
MSPSPQYPAERQHPASSKPIDFSPKMRARHRELLRRRKRFFDLRTRHRKGLLKDLGELLSASGNLASLRGSGANFVRYFCRLNPRLGFYAASTTAQRVGRVKVSRLSIAGKS